METFSRDELVTAMRLVLDEDDAIEIGEGAYALGEEARAHAAATGRSAEEQAFVHLAAMNLNEDTLILLALASEKGARTVEACRQWSQRVGGGSAESRAEAEARWNARYAQLAAALPRTRD